ncbi:helix-turn-helix domain-containing protein [Capnocytophaga sp.]|uniref:helix-turn-helix domain-containing protein n=1 Tax=Capnocytophaga sp. TaxID=44737 RepID=UPI0026DBFD64|nr:helix-turn-helix transcriptional regulator [Capnocytophaga sp.]MDO5104417.1 helix-turn-helix transcriptional regulator [Capnocytophaga sp.]
MDIEILSQQIKELRKIKCLSQEELATQSGVSLRTVQRVENAERTPSAETLKRILGILGTTYEQLKKQQHSRPLRTLKGVREFVHIFDNKLIISKSIKEKDVLQNYKTSVANLMEAFGFFMIFILSSVILTIVLYFLEAKTVAALLLVFTILWIIMIQFLIPFSWGIPYIDRQHIVETKMEKTGVGYANFLIAYREGNHIKERCIVFKMEDLKYILEGLRAEKLLDEKPIKLNFDNIVPFLLIPVMVLLMNKFSVELIAMAIYWIISMSYVMIRVIIKFVSYQKKHARQSLSVSYVR